MRMSGLAALAAIILLGLPALARAQGYNGGYSNGMRSGATGAGSYGGTSTTTNPSAGYPSTAPSGNRNVGTGQSRPEGALGMTPQLQRELGIGRQQ